MGKPRYLVAFVACLVLFLACFFIAHHMYWGLFTPNDPVGRYFLFKRPLPNPIGHLLWVGLKPLLIATPLAAAWSLYRYVQTWRQALRVGVCRKCGYDLRGSKDRCPECGTPIERTPVPRA